MRINVLFFAVFRQRLGTDEQPLELNEGATVADAVRALEEQHEVVRDLRGRYRTAVNQDMVDESHVLTEGDELVLIPPVAGGNDERHVRVTSETLSLDRVVAAVSGPRMGGLVTFVGVVRDHNNDHAVDHLEYEAYEPMAIKTMREIVDGIEKELDVVLAVEHRVGHLEIGEAAVAIACAAPHRAEAFQGCRAMIDRLKEHVPIWKREVSPDGEEWIGLGP